MNIALYPAQTPQAQALTAAVYDGYKRVMCAEIENPDYSKLDDLADKVLEALKADKVERVICPGGLLRPTPPGVYPICANALSDAKEQTHGDHLYNLVMAVAEAIARKCGAEALMIDPISSDELLPLNRMSSLSNVPKRSRYYAFEHRAALACTAREAGVPAEERNVIVCKIDRETSVGAHLSGICIEVNDVLGGEGPMGFTSAGDVPVAQLTAHFFDLGKDLEKCRAQLTEDGGIWGYAGAKTSEELTRLIECGNDQAATAAQLLAYQTAKWIGMCAMALKGDVDAILVIGEGALSPHILDALRGRVGKIAPIQTPRLDYLDHLGLAAYTAHTNLRPPVCY
ncbi:MAG: hypothetical protein FWE20_04200 [Defluviitaleaceae bacterium]|nr:hypothetical protein [Defluviitaleaceae bacterium]